MFSTSSKVFTGVCVFSVGCVEAVRGEVFSHRPSTTKEGYELVLYKVHTPSVAFEMTFAQWVDAAKQFHSKISSLDAKFVFNCSLLQNYVSEEQRHKYDQAYAKLIGGKWWQFETTLGLRNLWRKLGNNKSDDSTTMKRSNRLTEWYEAIFEIDAAQFNRKGQRLAAPIWEEFIKTVYPPPPPSGKGSTVEEAAYAKVTTEYAKVTLDQLKQAAGEGL